MNNYDDFVGAPVYDRNGEKIGTIADLYYTVDSNRPEWATVKSGFFGLSKHFVPLTDTREDEDGITINNVTHEMVKNAPSIEGDDETTDEDDARLRNYYKYNDQAMTGEVPDLDNVEPMPNVEMSERNQGDDDVDMTPRDTAVGSMHDAMGNAETERHVLRRYVAKQSGKQWDTSVVVERTPIDESTDKNEL